MRIPRLRELGPKVVRSRTKPDGSDRPYKVQRGEAARQTNYSARYTDLRGIGGVNELAHGTARMSRPGSETGVISLMRRVQAEATRRETLRFAGIERQAD
jgi:hypothetical protein